MNTRELRAMSKTKFQFLLDLPIVAKGTLEELNNWALEKGLTWKENKNYLFKGYWVDKQNSDSYLIT